VTWNAAEKLLIKHSQCDMLTIMDTCYTSDINLTKTATHEDDRIYLELTASAHGRDTVGPGPKSFTAALIRALDDLLLEIDGGTFSIYVASIETERPDPPWTT